MTSKSERLSNDRRDLLALLHSLGETGVIAPIYQPEFYAAFNTRARSLLSGAKPFTGKSLEEFEDFVLSTVDMTRSQFDSESGNTTVRPAMQTDRPKKWFMTRRGE